MITAKPDTNMGLVALRMSLRKYRMTGMHGEVKRNRESWSDAFDFEVHFTLPGGGVLNLSMDGKVRNGYTDESVEERSTSSLGLPYHRYTETYRPTQGYWHLGDDYQADRLRSAVEGLPSDAALSWEIYLDAGTSSGLVEKKLHGDHLSLHAKWKRGAKEIQRVFLIDVAYGQSARF